MLPPFLGLPVELHLDIISRLELHDRVNLAFTNQYLRSIIPSPSHIDFLVAEVSSWATARHLYACKGCVRFRRYEEFADDMKKGKRCRGLTEANTRFCLKCGVDGLYDTGTRLTICGKSHVFCRTCGTLTDQIGEQGACARCSPSSQWHCMRFRSSNNRDFDQEDEWYCARDWSTEGKHIHEYYDVWLRD